MTTTAQPTKGRLFTALTKLADELCEKQAAAGHVKVGEPTPPDPKGPSGGSSHPSADVDNSAQPATEGERSRENAADVKADQGPPAVDNATAPGSQDDVQLNIGTQQSATGEDPATEDDYKGDKDDPGTTHPATTEDGEKYGSLTFKEARAKFVSTANAVLADLANGFGGKPTSIQAGVKQAAAAVQQPVASQPELTAQAAAGYSLAAALGLSKEAAQQSVMDVLAATIAEQEEAAGLLGNYLQAFAQKQAADDEVAEGEEAPADDTGPPKAGPPAGPGDAAAPAAGPGGPGGPAGPGGLEALLGGGGPTGPAEAAPMGGGEPSEDEALAELAAALDELGIPVEALLEAAGDAGGAGGAPDAAMAGPGGPGPGPGLGPGPGPMAGPPPGGELGPMSGPEKLGYCRKLASAVTRFRRAGKYQIKAATTPQQRQLRDAMKDHVRELLGL
jgi:hypothetical protein